MSGFTQADVPDQSNKTFVVTGANTGMGFECTCDTTQSEPGSDDQPFHRQDMIGAWEDVARQDGR